MQAGRARILFALMTDQAVIDLVERVAHRAAVVRQLKTVTAAQFLSRTAHDVVKLRFRMDQMNQILIVEGVRRLESCTICFDFCEKAAADHVSTS